MAGGFLSPHLWVPGENSDITQQRIAAQQAAAAKIAAAKTSGTAAGTALNALAGTTGLPLLGKSSSITTSMHRVGSVGTTGSLAGLQSAVGGGGGVGGSG